MSGLKKYWDGLSRYERWILLKKNRFWDGLSDFKFEEIPEDLKPVLRQQMERKRP